MFMEMRIVLISEGVTLYEYCTLQGSAVPSSSTTLGRNGTETGPPSQTSRIREDVPSESAGFNWMISPHEDMGSHVHLTSCPSKFKLTHLPSSVNFSYPPFLMITHMPLPTSHRITVMAPSKSLAQKVHGARR